MQAIWKRRNDRAKQPLGALSASRKWSSMHCGLVWVHPGHNDSRVSSGQFRTNTDGYLWSPEVQQQLGQLATDACGLSSSENPDDARRSAHDALSHISPANPLEFDEAAAPPAVRAKFIELLEVQLQAADPANFRLPDSKQGGKWWSPCAFIIVANYTMEKYWVHWGRLGDSLDDHVKLRFLTCALALMSPMPNQQLDEAVYKVLTCREAQPDDEDWEEAVDADDEADSAEQPDNNPAARDYVAEAVAECEAEQAAEAQAAAKQAAAEAAAVTAAATEQPARLEAAAEEPAHAAEGTPGEAAEEAAQAAAEEAALAAAAEEAARAAAEEAAVAAAEQAGTPSAVSKAVVRDDPAGSSDEDESGNF